MTSISIALFISLVALAIGQAVYVVVFSRAMSVALAQQTRVEKFERAAVILCLRGNDPFLRECIDAVLRLDYPDYSVHIIVDHEQDPSWATVRQATENLETAQVHFHELRHRQRTCSLKCSSLLQVISGLDSECQFVALLDADTIPHEKWLQSLASGFNQQEVGAGGGANIGAVSGIRWYMPRDARWGSLVRYLWNSAAVVQMYWYEIAWGGTLAIKTSLIRDSDLLDRWSRSFCEDTMLRSVLLKSGQRLAFVPDLLMVNRESCKLNEFFGWVVRQLLTARLYHNRWLLVVFHAMVTTFTATAAVAFVMIAFCLNRPFDAATVLVGLLVFQIANYILLVKIELTVRSQVLGSRGEHTWLSAETVAKLLLAVPLTQILHFAAVIKTVFLRSVRWRGIDYDIAGPFDIKMRDYRPYHQTANTNETDSL